MDLAPYGLPIARAGTCVFTPLKLLPAYYLAMGTKQHKTFCPACGKTTNHVTVYQKADDGGQLVATVWCAEHFDVYGWS